jgi:hypothetical protein
MHDGLHEHHVVIFSVDDRKWEAAAVGTAVRSFQRTPESGTLGDDTKDALDLFEKVST